MISDFEASMQVYIVDDDDVDRSAIARVCDQIGVAFKEYSCPLALLDDLAPDSTGCVITDFRMPKMSGLQLYRTIQSRGLRVSTILVTGLSASMFEHGVVGTGLFGYCQKDDARVN